MLVDKIRAFFKPKTHKTLAKPVAPKPAAHKTVEKSVHSVVIPAPVQPFTAEEAQRVIIAFTSARPSNGEAWFNMAKAQHAIGQHDKALQALTRALTLEPTHANAQSWWIAIYQDRLEKKGMNPDKAYYRVLMEAEKRFGGVMPKLWLGTFCIKHQQKKLALDWFARALNIEPIDSYTITQVSAELVQQAWYTDIINLISSRYRPKQHGAACGINVLRAYYEFKDATAGEALVAELKTLQDPSQEANIAWYEEAFKAFHAPPAIEAQIGWSFVQMPIWCYGFSKTPMGFEGEPSEKRILLFQFTDEMQDHTIAGPSRTLPLHLSQQISSQGEITAEFLFPIQDEQTPTLLSNLPVDKEQIQAEFTGQYAGVLLGEWQHRQWVLTYMNLDDQTEQTQMIPFEAHNPQTALDKMNHFIMECVGVHPKPLDHMPDNFLRAYLEVLDAHLQLYITLQYPDKGEPRGLTTIIRETLNLAIGLPMQSTELLLLGTIQKCMQFRSQIIKDSQSVLQAWLDEHSEMPGPLQNLITQTQGEFRAYCEGLIAS